ncbi:acid phosphatase [Sulfolobus sp. A20]|uniref:phospholipase C n=1 Tax=Saccharolobus sp. A20 TaxID=1891280 RepID=UPI000845F0A8|nr:alkaline phosphatase family protein [Sulfolobus sp. A20]TRM74893.1 acid phosphatase [Sulfolobus sp. E5]TRM79457.1 acid phosphatase [Sulfolobus sp. B5]TRM88982.1 acid phosphatase [Sulfolobus sp. C3]TRM89331.1 acid phosphatase [Sulfolobus sp. E3]TRN01852.1 acid phosphatase [Sulfolobus sp. F1]TRN04775.1 acid phosphatase [Sulfolobus sp. E1]
MRKVGIIILSFVILILPSIHLSIGVNNNTVTPIKHIIIIIQENHSFDNLFGTYPFGYPPIVNNITLSVMEPVGLYDNYTQLLNSKNRVLTYISVPNIPWLPILGYSHPYYANANSTVDPNEGWTTYHGDYWFDTPNGFVLYSGPQSLAYFSYQQLSPLWDYAEEYVLADNYFAPVMGLTEPNRIAYLTGFPPPFYSDDASSVIPVNESIFYQLSSYNISWMYYVYDYQGGVPWPLNAFTGISEYRSHFAGLSQFYYDLKSGNLPEVSWVMFLGGGSDMYDMHPPANLLYGEEKLVEVINAVMESKYWSSTVIFITFDEGGGYYDQVIPPAINHYGLGQRIPLLIISPYAKEAYINNYTLSGYTLLGFIDYNFHLPYITSLAEMGVDGLLQSFNFSMKPRPPIILTPENWTYPIPLQYPIHYGFIAIVPQYRGYAQVYNMPEMSFLLPLIIISFALLLASFKKKVLLLPSFIIFLLTLGISGYVYETNNIYQYVSEYYLASSLVGFLITSLILAKRRYSLSR